MARDSFSFTVFGFEPAPQGSKKYVGSRMSAAGNAVPMIIESSPRLPAWRKAVSDAVIQGMKDSGDDSKFEGAVKVEAVFYLTRRPTVKRDLPTVPPDVDKLARSLLDGITAKDRSGVRGVWGDDSQVVRLEVSKVYATGQAGVAVTISKWPEKA
jgi:Holliday junction resolvase RusA-like endonuclease